MTLNQKAEARADAAGPATPDEKLDTLLKGLTTINTRLDSDEKARTDADSKVMEKLDSMSKRLDACEGYMDKARKDAEEKEKDEKAKADAARKDADEKEKKEKEEKEEKERADAEAKEKDEKARADAAARATPDLQAQIAALHKMMPAQLSDADRPLFAAAQAKADRIAQAFADDAGAPRPMNGEVLPDYRRRLMSKYKAHSPAWKDVDLAKIADDAALGVAETQIYADAMQAALHPAAEVGERMISEVDYAKRTINRFVGSETAPWKAFQNPDRRGRFAKPAAA